MAKSEVERVTEEKIAKGGVLTKLYFDMQQEDKAKLQPLMLELINEHLLKENGVVYCYGAIEEPLEREGVFITSAEVTMLFDSFKPLIHVAFFYSPAGIEILKPKTMALGANELQSMLMDLSQISLDYSKYTLEHVLKPEDMERIEQQFRNRLELGKRIMEKKGGEEKK
jgi:hypothetical protein